MRAGLDTTSKNSLECFPCTRVQRFLLKAPTGERFFARPKAVLIGPDLAVPLRSRGREPHQLRPQWFSENKVLVVGLETALEVIVLPRRRQRLKTFRVKLSRPASVHSLGNRPRAHHGPLQRGREDPAQIAQQRVEVRRIAAAHRSPPFHESDATNQERPQDVIGRSLENLQQAPALIGPCFDLLQNLDESRRSVPLEVCHRNGNSRGRQNHRSDSDGPPPAAREGRNAPLYV